ncbi:MAG: hypothetical protein JOY80_05655 [Candidatus Dormibacteraeota bacterium]|nr:hypothetical protein [Candidatus Dormibacteraeota bacterium]
MPTPSPLRTSRIHVSARKTYDLIDEPVGPDYDALLDSALTQCTTIVVMTRGDIADEPAGSVLERLSAFEQRSVETSSAVSHHFKLTQEAVAVLKDVARGLYAWQQPELPADLCLLRADGSPWLVSIAAERLGYLELTPFEKLLLGRTAPGLAAVLAHQAARDAILASFERRLEAHIEVLTGETLVYASKVMGEGREGVVDALESWLSSREESRVHVALEVTATLGLVELRPEVSELLRALLGGDVDDPEAYRTNVVLRERWRARRRRLLERTLERLDAAAVSVEAAPSEEAPAG